MNDHPCYDGHGSAPMIVSSSYAITDDSDEAHILDPDGNPRCGMDGDFEELVDPPAGSEICSECWTAHQGMMSQFDHSGRGVGEGAERARKRVEETLGEDYDEVDR